MNVCVRITLIYFLQLGSSLLGGGLNLFLEGVESVLSVLTHLFGLICKLTVDPGNGFLVLTDFLLEQTIFSLQSVSVVDESIGL